MVYGSSYKKNSPAGHKNLTTAFQIQKDTTTILPNSENQLIYSPLQPKVDNDNYHNRFYDFGYSDSIVYKEANENLRKVNEKYYTKQENEQNVLNNNSFFFDSNDWIVGILLLSAIVVAFAKVLFKKHFSGVFQSVFNYNVAYKLFGESSTSVYRVFFLLSIVFIINMSMFFSHSFDIYNVSFYNLSGFEIFGVFTGIIFVLYMVKKIILNFLGYLLEQKEAFAEYSHHISIFNQATGLFLFPVIASLPYIQPDYHTFVFEIAVGFLALFFLLRLIRGFRIIIRNKVSLLYAILYLCALELMPVLIYYRLFKQLT